MESLLLSPATEGAGLCSFLDTTQLEFQASLQLLVERAVFLTGATGAAIALKENAGFVYCAVAGEISAEPGSKFDLGDASIPACIEQPAAVRTKPCEKEAAFTLRLPILSADKAVGIFELKGQYEFQDQDVDAVRRIADLVSVAVEYRNGADASAKIAEREIEIKEKMQPASWHAPEATLSQPAPSVELNPAPPVAPIAQACTSCGFPVSPGRTLCVDCERKPDAHPTPKSDLFTLPNDESWFSAHGYTLVAALIPAIAAAVYFWLRH